MSKESIKNDSTDEVNIKPMKHTFFVPIKSPSKEIDSYIKENDALVRVDSPLSNLGNSIEKWSIKRFTDGGTPIAYKEGYIDGKPSSKSTTQAIMEHREKIANASQKGGQSVFIEENTASYLGLSLVKQEDSTWMIYDHATDTFFKPLANQSYNFVTMPDNTIRIAPAEKGGHALLADYTRYIRYAGEVVFDNEHHIKTWKNQSGGYYPPPGLAFQAGFFGNLSKFQPEYDRNDPALQRSQTFRNLA